MRLLPIALWLSACVLLAARTSSPGRLDIRSAWHSPDAQHWLGCGEGGIDIATLLGHAVLRGVILAGGVALVSFVLGTLVGAWSALERGWIERLVERACDLVQAFPTFLLALVVLSAVEKPTRIHIAGVFMLTAWAPFARLALAEARVIRSAAFVEAAFALGETRRRVLLRHVVPNMLDVLSVQLGATASALVVSEASLAFVGFGPADGVSLGQLLDQGVAGMLAAPHVMVFAVLGVFLTSTGLLVAGRSLSRRH